MEKWEPNLENGWIHTAHTIERQLKLYAKSDEATERHQILWHAWNQNKRWLAQLLEWTLPSFQTFSYHNATHSESVLYNIERLLGEERIKKLSATDCFMLLHVAYMHDVGMSISSAERQSMVQDNKFIDMIEHLETEGDSDMRRAAQSVLQTKYTIYEGVSSRERTHKMHILLQEKLDAYYGLGQLMAEYQREMHASKVRERLQKQTLDPDKLGNSFSVSGIPLRIFLKIADCAAIHATSGIKAVLELPKEDGGYASDTIHPRFVAVMLQLGDALDMDNDRFNPFCFQFAGNFPQTSTLHYKKHQAIRQLNITPETIQIHADCESQEVLRLVRMECESLEDILKNVSYHWAEIAPNDVAGCLPALDQSKILLEGQQVPGELVKAQFNISQVRAFRLLEGANVYGGRFVFLREIIQNAIDASKMQCWEDYIYRCKLKERKILQDNFETVEYGLNASEKEILSEVDVWDYPIEIYFELGARLQSEEEFEFVPIEVIEKMEETKERQKIEKEYGIRITIRDHGTGISKDDLIKISNVGSSYEEKKHFIDKMPDWLKPTGQFGIGLQSAFLVTESVTAKTYTRSGEKYKITFNKVSNGSGGYINVRPLPQEEYLTFGTTFEIFLNYKNKWPHADFWEAWNTESADADRFIDGYDKMRPIRHSKELLNQLILYIDNMLGENLFPIYVKVKGNAFERKQYDFIAKRVKKIVFEADIAGPTSKAEQEKNVSWLFKAIKLEKEKNQAQDKDDLIIVDIKDGIGALDCRQSKLYIWNSELGVFARFGGGRMLSAHLAVSKAGELDVQDRRKIRIYLKGIFIQSHSMYQDSELLELIDIKGGRIGKAHIAVSRDEFTKEGIAYLEQEIYPALISSAKAALVELNERENRVKDGLTPFYLKIMKSISDKTALCQNDKENQETLKLDLEETVLSAVGLSYFLRILGKEKEIFCEKQEMAEECRWDSLLNEIVEFRLQSTQRNEKCQARDGLQEAFDRYINAGMMHKMKVFFFDEVKRTGFVGTEKEMDYASLLLERRKVAIISMRHNEYTKWFHIPMIICEQEKIGDTVHEAFLDKVQKNSYAIFQKKSTTWQEEQEILSQMEVWADRIFVWIRGIEDIQQMHESYGTDSDIQYTLNYMLENIPTIALYADKSGNVRINVLSVEEREGIFFNKSMKRIILKKVNDLYVRFQAKRFVTNVWRSYECIALETDPSSVCSAKGGFIARHQTSKMLLPILGENAQKLLNIQEQDFFREIREQKRQCEQLEELCDELMGFRQKLMGVICEEKVEDMVDAKLNEYLKEEMVFEASGQRDVVHGRNLVRYYWQEMITFARSVISDYRRKQVKEDAKDEFRVLWENRPQSKKEESESETAKEAFQREFIRRFFEDRGTILEVQETIANVQRENNWMWFLKAISFIGRYRNLNIQEQVASHPRVAEFKRSLWGRPADRDLENVQNNMINYVMKHATEKLSEKQIRNCYEKLLDDMLECVLEIETEEKRKYTNIDSLF
ncbi:MAG: hypothetical protein HFI91_07460 [Lachnospiraceae bacterium]|nr:hypothetical protein [Lachnospiraceae bacterium]